MKFAPTLLLVVSVLFAKAQNLALGLQACYPFDMTAQNAAATGAALDGTLVNCVNTQGHNSIANTAIKLNGSTGSYIALPDHPGLKSDPVFFAGWFRFDALNPLQYMVYTHNGCTSQFESYSLVCYHASGNQYRFRLSKSSGNCSVKPEINSTTLVVTGTWYHVACYVTNSVMKLYVNGTLESTIGHSVQFAYQPGKNVFLGVTNQSNFNPPMAGSIDNLRFYNRDLTAQELNLLVTQDPLCGAPVLPGSIFTASQYTICAGNNITFTDQSTGSPTSWSWKFQGGNPSTSTHQNPTVNYPVAGVYTVALTASNANGAGNTSTQTVTVKNCAVPASIFNASPNKICAGNNITFTDQSTQSPTSWNWQFQGGNPATSTLQNPTVNYPAAGIYTVALIASNVNGAGNTSIQTVTVEVCAGVPGSIFTASPNKICAGNNITFIDQSTESPTMWNWQFQGGNPATSTQQNPTVNYPTAGVYTVALTASNVKGTGNTSIQTLTVEVCAGAPASIFTTSQNKICAGNNITFIDQSTESPASWNWKFQGGNPASSTHQNPTVNYPLAGVYTVSLTASNANGAGNTSIQLVTVELCTGMTDLNGNGSAIEIYPNPASDHLLIKGLGDNRLDVFDLLGKPMKALPAFAAQNDQTVDLRGLVPGIYFIQVRDTRGHHLQTIKFVKSE